MSTDAATNTPDPPCYYLAMTGNLLAAVVSALLFHGWTTAGHASDLVPCILSALLIPATVVIAGRVADYRAAIMVCCGCLGAIACGKLLTWQVDPDALVAEPMNLLFCGLTPLIAAGLLVMMGNGLLKSLRPRLFLNKLWATRVHSASAVMRGMVLVWLVVVSGIYLIALGTDRTGFRMITLPFDAPSGDLSLLGFSVIVDAHPVMAETLPAVEQVSWFAGALRSDNNFRFLRAGYAFLAAQLTPVFDQTTSLLIVNFLAWLGSLALVWILTVRWTASEVSASAAVCLASVGIGFGVHINDTTPHLTSFFLFYLGIVLVDHYQFGETRRPWKAHLVWALIVGLISLEYNVAQMLLFVYGVVSMKKQRWVHVIAAALIAMSLRPLWQIILPGLGINVREVEGAYLIRSLQFWGDSFRQGIGQLLADLGYFTIESLTALESPWLLILASAGLFFIPDSRRRFLCVLIVSAPVLACVFFAPTSNSRGYIVYGASLVIFLSSGNLFGHFIARGGNVGRAAVMVFTAVCAIQLVWTTAHHRFWVAPSKIFLMGAPKAIPLTRVTPKIESLTRREPLPTALGGTARFVDAGAFRTPATEPIPAQSLPLMFLSRVFFVGVILLTLWVTVDDRPKRRLATVITASAFLVCGVLSFTRIDHQPFVFDPQSLPIAPRGTANYSLRLRTGVADQLEIPWGIEEPVRIELYLGSSDPVELRWLADGTEIPIRRYKQSRWVTDSLWDLNKLQETRSWTFQITNPSDQLIRVRGWQRTALPDRRLDSPLPSPVLPGIEVRVRDPGSGALRFAAY